MPLIGFVAKRRRGKDTSCDYIHKKYGYTKRAFAEPLKRGVQELFGFTDEQLYTDKKEEVDFNWGVTPRHVCQVVGTDVVRNMFPKLLIPDIGDNFWIKNFDIWYEKHKDKFGEDVVVSDVRFQNEVDYILSKGGFVFKITRPEMDMKEIKDVDFHSSELCIDGIKNYNFEIINSGTIDEFLIKVDELVKNHML